MSKLRNHRTALPGNGFRDLPLDSLAAHIEPHSGDWLWHGYLLPGNITLMTSQWKTGKTTLLTGLLRIFATGGDFLGRSVREAKVLIVSEESVAQWAERVEAQPIGPHVRLLSRPFRGKPSFEEWNELIDEAFERVKRSEINLFVIDPLAFFLPGRCESDSASLLETLQPLQRLAREGAAVLILHHPRKKASEPGQSARGSGALLGFVDIVLELNRFSKLESDARCRQLVALSRKPETPARMAYEWKADSNEFVPLVDSHTHQFEANWQVVLAILGTRTDAVTHAELLVDWPAEREKPSSTQLYQWLNRAFAEKRIRREGKGTKSKPWRYRLAQPDDAFYDRGELPPIEVRKR